MKAKEICQQFIYTRLAEPSTGHTDPYNLFAVILDSTAPYAKDIKSYYSASETKKWMLNLKLIDPTLNLRAASILKEYQKDLDTCRTSSTSATVTFFSNAEVALPKIGRVGDIIRLQYVSIFWC